jgi:phenylpyruvate tautomerase PptA (4-oxalocrotonate tautomerase family)
LSKISNTELMAIYKCLVNGSIDDADRTRVAKELERVTTAHFGKDLDGVRVEFVEVEPGSWFTGGNPSAASMVLGSVPAGTTQDVRTELMDEIARTFSAVTGSDVMDVMVVAADSKKVRN